MPRGWKAEHPNVYLDAGDGVVAFEFAEADRDDAKKCRPGDLVVLRGWCLAMLLDGADPPVMVPLVDSEVEKWPRGRKGFVLPPSD